MRTVTGVAAPRVCSSSVVPRTAETKSIVISLSRSGPLMGPRARRPRPKRSPNMSPTPPPVPAPPPPDPHDLPPPAPPPAAAPRAGPAEQPLEVAPPDAGRVAPAAEAAAPLLPGPTRVGTRALGIEALAQPFFAELVVQLSL